MGLLPLEFVDCLTDSPYFRDNLHAHEKELEKTSLSIKTLIKDCKELLGAAKSLSKANKNLSNNLMQFKFDCIGSNQTDDEIIIAGSLKEFGKLISAIEDERECMLNRAYEQFIVPLEQFRKEQIGGAKEGKKKFDKQTAKFCQSLEKHLNLSAKRNDSTLQEADASLEMERRAFYQASLEYVFLLQEVQERKKFEFVETILGFMYGWLTFYHQAYKIGYDLGYEGHEVAKDFKPYMTDLQVRLQKTRENFNSTRDETEQLMLKMLEKASDPGTLNKMYTRQGYLFLMEKKALGTQWSKHYCMYQKENRIFTMIPYSQQSGKITNTETIVLQSCVRRITDSIDKRFCFDLTAQDKQGVWTMQALSEEDRRVWMDSMDGKEPIYSDPGKINKGEESALDDIGFSFIQKCVDTIEMRGLHDQGLYRVVGVNSKVLKLLQMGLDRRKFERLNLEDAQEWETKTITSALKNFFRNLPESLMTFRLHQKFIEAAKHESRSRRMASVHTLLHELPQAHLKMMNIIFQHLCKVAANCDKNLMTVANLGVCFGPTLLRPEEETVAAIMEIKFCNIVVEILIENYEQMFNSRPGGLLLEDKRHSAISKMATPPVKPSRPMVPAPLPPNLPPGEQQQRLQQQQQHSPPRPPAAAVPGTTPVAVAVQLPSSPNCLNSVHQHHRTGSHPQPQPPFTAATGSGGLTAPLHNHNVMTRSSPPNLLVTSLSSASPQTPPLHLTSNNSGGGGGGDVAPHHTTVVAPPQHHHHHTPTGPTTVRPTRLNRPSAIYEPGGGDDTGSHSSSTDSIGSSNNYSVSSAASSSPNMGRETTVNVMKYGTTYPSNYPRPDQILANVMKKRQSFDATLAFTSIGSNGSLSNHQHQQQAAAAARRVRTLYACEAENDSELSFEPGQIITNVRQSKEPGWLEGMLNGKTGLIPENYVEYLP